MPWIKLRSDLFTHPRFLRLCVEVAARNEGVTEVLQRSVTNRNETVTEAVTLLALMRVWLAVNAHCKVAEMDAVMPLCDVDQIAGIAGFAAAMRAVGWLADGDANSLVFPNFREFNEPACIRREPLTNAQRQALFRARKKESAGCVTEVTKSNGRLEKRREEKNKEKHPPKAPLRGDVDAQSGLFVADPEKPKPPTAQEFVVAWNEVAAAGGWTPCRELGEGPRLKAFRARLKDRFWVEHWRAALAAAAPLLFCRGENARGWVANVEWFLRPRTAVRLLEGFYDDRRGRPQATRKETTAEIIARLRKEQT